MVTDGQGADESIHPSGLRSFHVHSSYARRPRFIAWVGGCIPVWEDSQYAFPGPPRSGRLSLRIEQDAPCQRGEPLFIDDHVVLTKLFTQTVRRSISLSRV